MSWRSSRPELRGLASDWGSLWESSSFVPWFILNAFRDASGLVPEWPWITGFMRKSSIRASAPSMRFSVLLNSSDNLLVTLPSISSGTWVMKSSCDLGTFEFCARLLLRCSSQFFYSRLLVSSCFELPFLREKCFRWLIVDCLFYCRVKLEVYSFSIGKWNKINEDWLKIVSNINQ